MVLSLQPITPGLDGSRPKFDETPRADVTPPPTHFELTLSPNYSVLLTMFLAHSPMSLLVPNKAEHPVPTPSQKRHYANATTQY